MASKAKKGKSERLLFQLDGMTKIDLRKASQDRDSDNVSHMINQALKWYIHCLNSKDKGLENFLAEKIREAKEKLES